MTTIIDVPVSETSYQDATEKICSWARTGSSHYVCAANVHVLMEAHDSPRYKKMIADADLVTPDGMPLVWMLRWKGIRGQKRVYGPTLMLHVLEAAVVENIPVGFYGSTPETVKRLVKRMEDRFRSLKVVFAYSPPFREMNREEDATVVEQINASGARILFVGLGCPKQEIWMAEHHGRIHAVLLGVGAAFDFHAGVKAQSPGWMQRLGLEWLFRLLTEPRRLWKRYLYNNPRFILLALADLARNFKGNH